MRVGLWCAAGQICIVKRTEISAEMNSKCFEVRDSGFYAVESLGVSLWFLGRINYFRGVIGCLTAFE